MVCLHCNDHSGDPDDGVQGNIFAAFIIGVLYAILTAKITYRKIRIFPMISKTFKTGAGESAGMIMYMACAYTVASGASAIRPVLQNTLGGCCLKQH